MDCNKYLFIVSDLDANQQTALFEMLSNDLTADEITALKIGVGYFRLIKNKEYHDIACRTMGEYFYQMFNNDK